MSNSVVLIAYEINAQTAKTVLQKRAGFSAKFKKFKVSNIVDHVATCWEQLEQLFVQEDARIEDRVLYTAKLRDPLRIGKVRNDILNNSFLMSVLVDDTQFGRQARAGARYYQFKTNSDFEKKQFSLMLEEAKGRFEHQEVGIFGWVSISDERVDGALKTVASKFSNLNDGELHFIELTQAGDIFPNFSNVSSQKFEGKLAGNYSLTLKRDEYESGIQRINEITSTVTRKSAIPVVSTTSETSQVQAPQEATETMSENTSNKKNTYSDDFKKEVAEAAQSPGATLASVGEQFGVSPTLVRNWKIKFSEEVETPTQSEEKQPKIESKSIQSWLQKSVVEGTIDSDGDLYVSLETSSEETTQEPTKLFITGTQKLASGSKNETSGMSDQITTNETNWLRSDFLKGVGRENAQFSYNLNCDVYGCAERVVVPTKLKKGKVSECPITAGQIGISELNFVFEDGDFRAEGTITGPNGFIYAAEVLTEEPEEGHVPAVNKTADDENSAEMYEFLWDVKKGDTVFVVLCAFERLDGKLSCGFTGEAKVEEPISYDDGDDTNDFDEDKYSDYTEVVIDDEENEQYYYWVLTDDEDEAVEAALKKHNEMGRPSAVNDEDAGIFPMAYQPVTEFGSESAIKIDVDGTDVSGIDDVNKAFKYDQIHHVSVIQVSSDADWPEAEPISAKNLTLLVNSKTEKTAYYIGDQMTDGPYEADHFFEAIPDYVTAVSEELKGRLPIPNEHLSSTKELFIGMLQDDLDDFNFETDLNAELENFEDTDLSQRMGEIGFRSLSLHHCSFTINDGQLIYGGDTITNEGELFEELEQGKGKYCFINAAKPTE